MREEVAIEMEQETFENYPSDAIQLTAIDCSILSDEVGTMYPLYISPPSDMKRLLDECSNISSK